MAIFQWSLNINFKLILRRFDAFSDVWSENAALFERLMEMYSNPPILYFAFKMCNDLLGTVHIFDAVLRNAEEKCRLWLFMTLQLPFLALCQHLSWIITRLCPFLALFCQISPFKLSLGAGFDTFSYIGVSAFLVQVRRWYLLQWQWFDGKSLLNWVLLVHGFTFLLSVYIRGKLG